MDSNEEFRESNGGRLNFEEITLEKAIALVIAGTAALVIIVEILEATAAT